MYNKDLKESGYAFFDVDAGCAAALVAKPHLIGHAFVNCKIAADNSQISLVQKGEMERKLYVSNLPPGTSDLDLFNLFQPFGKLMKAYLVRNRANGSCKNFGFVIFQQLKDANRLLLDKPVIRFRERKLTIKQAVDRQTQKKLQTSQQTHEIRPKKAPISADYQCSAIKSDFDQIPKFDDTESNYRFNVVRPVAINGTRATLGGPRKAMNREANLSSPPDCYRDLKRNSQVYTSNSLTVGSRRFQNV